MSLTPPDDAPDLGSDLAADTAVTPVASAPGTYTADLPDAWSFLMPSGGVLMTLALRAMRAELADPALRPMAATATFCWRVPAGPMRISVDVLRRGRSAAQLRATLVPATAPPGSGAGEGLEVSATFVFDREGPDMLESSMPDVPSPADAPPFFEGAPIPRFRMPFFRNFEARLALGRPWWLPDWRPGPARFARWIRYRKPQLLPGGLFDPLALPPIADTMPSALWTRLGPNHPRYIAPSLDLTVHFLEDTSSDWLLLSSYCRRARAGYATAENEIWGEDGRLVAFATQTMFLKKIPPA